MSIEVIGTPQIKIVSIDPLGVVQIEVLILDATGNPLFNVIPNRWLSVGDTIKLDGMEARLTLNER